MDTLKGAKTVFLLMSLMCMFSSLHSQSFQGVGDIAGGSYESYAEAVSGDGETVVGRSVYNSSGDVQGFAWRSDISMVPLGFLSGGKSSYATAVSYNGSVIVGGSDNGSSQEGAVRWINGTISTVGSNWYECGAFGVSGNGNVIVGYWDKSGSTREAARFVNGSGWAGLGYLTISTSLPYKYSRAYAVSEDGNSVVGMSRASSPEGYSKAEAFKWVKDPGAAQTGTMTSFGQHTFCFNTPTTYNWYIAYAISANGNYSCGMAEDPYGPVAWRGDAFMENTNCWNSQGITPDISTATAISGDGSVVVGWYEESSSPGVKKAFYATFGTSKKMIDLKNLLVSQYGLNLSGWTLTEATGISKDGNTIVGNGINPQGKKEGWIAKLTGASNQPQIIVDVPNGGESWNVGSTRYIRWHSLNFNEHVMIWVSYAGYNPQFWVAVDYMDSTENDGSYEWVVPDNPSNNCIIKVADADDGVPYDVSNGPFSITGGSGQASITLDVPNGGENWVAGTTHYIVWHTNQYSGPVKIEYSTDAGSSYSTLENSYSGSNSYEWIIPSTPSNQCLVRISDPSDGDPSDISNAVFTISGSGTNNTPSGSNISVDLGSGVELVFGDVTAAGFTDMDINTTGPQLPENYQLIPLNNPRYYDITTTASFTGNVNIFINYDDSGLNPDQEAALNLMAYDGSIAQWVDVTANVDAQNNVLHGIVDHFSIFGIMFSSGGTGGNELLVTNTDDSGPGSLRQAIMDANSSAGPDTILFNLPEHIPGYDPDVGVWIISPQSQLPRIFDFETVIDGYSQSRFLGTDKNPNGPEIWLDGSQAGDYAYGLHLEAPDVRIYGLIITNFHTGIYVRRCEAGRIAGCYVGVGFSGNEALPNDYGIYLTNQTKYFHVTPYDTIPNVISGNNEVGIAVSDSSSSNVILGNYIGLNREGNQVIGNGNRGGIYLDTESNQNEIVENRIGGNKIGINIFDSKENRIISNLIGTNGTWEFEVGNQADGIYIFGNSQDNVMEDNIIAYNSNGVHIYGENAVRNMISGNLISQNQYYGIYNDSGGNNELSPPTIQSVSGGSIIGTSVPNAIIEIFSDNNNQGMHFHGETIADASGNFNWSGEVIGQNITATATDEDGNTSQFSNPVSTGVEEELTEQEPESFSLNQNYPNPFNPETVISYRIAEKAEVLLKVYDLLGQEVATLVNEEQLPGEYRTKFNARGLPSGIYFYKIRCGEFKAIRKMIVIE